MKVLKCLLNITCLFIAVSLAGCIVTFEEATTIEVEEIEIDYPPPPAPPEVVVTRPARPSRHHVWIGSHHIVSSGTWVWVHGHWAKPPHSNAAWMPCHTRRKSELWVWAPGYWF